jgi:hypothetical protein
MNAEDLPAIAGKELERRKYFVRMDILDQTASLVKIRLYITPDLFVQMYRNDRYQTTNLVLIYNNSDSTRVMNSTATGTDTPTSRQRNTTPAKRDKDLWTSASFWTKWKMF